MFISLITVNYVISGYSYSSNNKYEGDRFSSPNQYDHFAMVST